jgi:dihydrofolate synthase/folylpolyglutamate synthase
LQIPAPATLAEWLAYLESLHPKTIALGLERVVEVKRRLNLHPEFPVIVVGGTNGKGSVCAMLESMLHAAGYRVGCYTSPHLLRYNERVRIEKQALDDAALCASFEKIEQVRGEIPLTYFEFGTLAAMERFVAAQVEVAILEIGLGGRLDAVNAFDADCAVITSVDIDHTDYLGDTREAIAFEKAGILRAGRPAIYGEADMPVAIAEQAKQIGAILWQVGEAYSFRNESGQWSYRGPGGLRSGLPLPSLRGGYQLYNASAALAALDGLRDRLPVSMEAVRRGLVEASVPGRFQVLPGRPQIILDVAHNPHAARALAGNLAALPPAGRTWAVCAMLKDKDMQAVAQALGERIDVWLLGGIDAPRGATSEELAGALRAAQVSGKILTFPTVTDALRHACNAAAENDRIAAFGSFYTVAEVMHALNLRTN